jgi:type IX secretion system PorP/SprF family membrane protein
MKSRLIIFSISLLSTLSWSQQIPQYSQFARNQALVNPGAVGAYDFIDITMGGRWQWAGFTNAPMTGYLLVNSPVKKKTSRARFNPSLRVSDATVKAPEVSTGKLKHAVGGMFVADQYGAFRSMFMSGTYALHIPMTQKMNLSFGTRLGLSNNAFIQERAQVLSGTVDNEYSAYSSQGTNNFIMDLGAGLYLYTERLFVGIATDHLTKDLVNFGGGNDLNFNRKMHFNFVAGYKFKLNDEWTLTPSTIVKFMYPTPPSWNITLTTEYKEMLWFGFSYRHTDAVVGMLGTQISNKFKLGYSFDFSISKFNKVSSGGHELILGIMLGR